MAGRKPKGFELDQKVKTYEDTYELDDLNEANDRASIKALAQYEILIEKLQSELAGMKKISDDPKKVKDLHSALRDAVNSYTSLQTTLGIDRKKRSSEKEESVLSYVDRLKQQAKSMWESRLQKVTCPNCNLLLSKFIVYIQEKGDEGAISYEDKVIEPIKYDFSVECARCGKIVEVNHG